MVQAMKTTLFNNLFKFKIDNNLKISISENEVYNQFLLYAFSREKRDIIILTSTLNDSNKLFFKLKNYMDEVYIFPEDDYLTRKAIAASPDLLYMRMNLLNSLSNPEPKIVICHLNSFLKQGLFQDFLVYKLQTQLPIHVQSTLLRGLFLYKKVLVLYLLF